MRLLLIVLFINSIAFAQTETNNKSINKGSINEQFEYILRKSTNYQEYKVIKKTSINKLKTNVIDSLKKDKNELLVYKDSLQKKEEEYLALQNEIKGVNAELKAVTDAKDTIKLLGIPLKRNVFKVILWSLIGILSIALIYFIYIYKNANLVTQKSLKDFNELDEEYNSAKTRALEREQVLNRKLQDELNKQKKA